MTASKSITSPKVETAYSRLREAILSCALQSGAQLFERDLVKQIGVSRTSVRSALARLETEGLVQRNARGAFVATIDVAEIREILTFMKVLETAALTLSTPESRRQGIVAIARLVENFPPDDDIERFRFFIDSFHRNIVGLSGNGFFVRSYDDALTRIERAAWITARIQPEERADSSTYAAILAALETDRIETAAALLENLISQVADRMLAVIEKQKQQLQLHGMAIINAGP